MSELEAGDPRLLWPIIRHRHNAGDPLAVHDGLVWCRRQGLLLPDWLADALSAAVAASLKGRPKGSKGRSNVTYGRYRERLKRFIRRRTIEDVRAWQERDPDDPLRFTLLRTRRAMRMVLAGDFSAYNGTVGDALAIASQILAGTFAGGSEEVMRKEWGRKPVTGVTAAFAETAIAFDLMDPPGDLLAVPQAALDATGLSAETALKDLGWVVQTKVRKPHFLASRKVP